MPPPIPSDETERLAALKRYSVLDTPAEAALDRLTSLAARLFAVPFSTVSLIDETRQWVKSAYGLEVRQTARDLAFCAYTILSDDVFVIPDMLEDPRFRENPLVAGRPYLRFYAGAPLITPEGRRIGTLTILDRAPRADLPSHQRELLKSLAATVMDELQLRLAGIATAGIEAHRISDELRGIIEASPVAIISLDRNRTVRSWNAAAEQIFGWPAGEAIGRRYPIIPAGAEAEFDQYCRRMFEGDVLREEETVRQKRDGTLVEVSLSAAPLHNASGDIDGIMVVLSDITARKAAERALVESEQKYRNLVEQTPTAVAVHCHQKIVYANPSAVRLFGATNLEDMLGRDPAEFADPENLDRFRQRTRDVLAGRAAPRIEVKMRRLDGAAVYADVVSIPIVYEGCPAVQVVMRDITDRHRAEEELREHERDLCTLVDNLPAYIAIKDQDSRYRVANRKFAEAVNCPQDQIRGKTDFDLFAAEFATQFRREDVRTMSQGETLYKEERLRFPGGREVEVGTFKAPLRDPDGTVRGLVAMAFELTEKRAMEAALRQSEARFRRAVMDAPIPIMIHAEDGQVLEVNHAWLEQSGYSADRLKTIEAWVNAAHPHAPEVLDQIRTRYMMESRAEANEASIRTGSGGTRTWSFSTAPLGPMPDGRRIVITMAMDVTERRSLEQQLTQAQKMEAVGQLAGGVAHDFNNLLTVISGYSNLLLRSLGELDPAFEQVREISNAATRAAELTRQLLAFSRKQLLQPANVDINTIVRESERMLRRLIGEDIEVKLALLEEETRALVDPGQLVQVIMNLAVNARDAMPNGGVLTIETAFAQFSAGDAAAHPAVEPGTYVELVISDNGAGIEKSVLPRIFDPFFTTKGPGAGTGLGLSTVYGIIKQSNGHIAVYSEPGQGTTFRIYLPRVFDRPQVEQAPRRPAPSAGHETVLLVEDEPALRKLSREILRRAGYKVIEAANGGEALLACEQSRTEIPLMVTDLVMPGMSGKELAERLSVVRPNMKVLYMSGYTNHAALASGIVEGEVAFLQKPFTPSALTEKVRQILDQR